MWHAQYLTKRALAPQQPEPHRTAADMAAPAAAAVLPAAAAFAYSRGVDTDGMSGSEKRLAAKLRSGSFGRIVYPDQINQGVLAKPLNTLAYGTPHVYGDFVEDLPTSAKRHAAIFAPGETFTPPRHGRAEVLGAAPDTRLMDAMSENKLVEYGLLNKYAPGSVARTTAMSSIVNKTQGLPPEQRLAAMDRLLRKQFPKGFVLKGIHDSRTGGHILTDKDNLADIAKKFETFDKGKIERLLSIHDNPEHFEEWHDAITSAPDLYKYLTIRRALAKPTNVLAQERIDMVPLNLIDRVLEKVLRGRDISGQELRVHTTGSRVLPATNAAFGPLSQAASLVGYRDKITRDAERFVQSTLSKVPKKMIGNSSFAVDVARTPEGFKIIESNPAAYSAFLHRGPTNPVTAINNHRVLSALRGQNTMPVSAAHAMGAGAVGLGGYMLARRIQHYLSNRNKPANS
jgi:hypothetical protein